MRKNNNNEFTIYKKKELKMSLYTKIISHSTAYSDDIIARWTIYFWQHCSFTAEPKWWQERERTLSGYRKTSPELMTFSHVYERIRFFPCVCGEFYSFCILICSTQWVWLGCVYMHHREQVCVDWSNQHTTNTNTQYAIVCLFYR